MGRTAIRSTYFTPEKVAYWYFRLNGFLQIENFVVHPERSGSQRTDADILGVRFPFRAERLFDDPGDIMEDDRGPLGLTDRMIDVVIAEVKTNQPCTLNGPWTNNEKQNVHRVIAALGCLPSELIERAAEDIYRSGVHGSELGLRIRLIAIGAEKSTVLTEAYPSVVQLLWPNILAFIWDRFRTFRRQKQQVDQWDEEGRRMKELADRNERSNFINGCLHAMGVRAPRT